MRSSTSTVSPRHPSLGYLPTSRGFDHATYRVYCSAKENRCLRKAGSRGYWSSSSSVAEFGPAGEPGVLAGAGSPRWKQRAFYDFIKDLSPFVLDILVWSP